LLLPLLPLLPLSVLTLLLLVAAVTGIHFQNQKYAEAATISAEALRIQEKVCGPAHPRVASALNEVGKIALQQGRLDDADKCFSGMAEICREVYPNEHYLGGVAEGNLAGVYMERKQQNVGIGKVKLGRALLHEKRYWEA